jgi:hypothetical protein
MRCACIAVLLMVCLLQFSGMEAVARDKEPAAPDTSSASDIYNPPSVITPEYEAGPRPTAQGQPGSEPEPAVPDAPVSGRSAAKPCPACGGGARGRIGAGGEFASGYLFANLDDINSQVRRMGIPVLSDDIFVVGGRGYVRIGRLLIGGAGYGGNSESSGIPDCCSRQARLDIAYGGVILGLALGNARYETMAGMMFGGGSVEIVRERNSRTVAGWDDAWDGFDKALPDSIASDDLNMTSKITGEFIALEPFAEIKYWLLPFMALDVSASYLNAEVRRGQWKLDGVAIPDSPESGIGGWSVRLGFHFGI